MVAQDRVEEKIRKLIRLSENNPNEEEAARALEQAAAIAAKYHLDISAIGVDASQDPMLARGSDIVLSSGFRYPQWKWQLAHTVARVHGCAPWNVYQTVYTLGEEPRDPNEALAGSPWANNPTRYHRVEKIRGPRWRLTIGAIFGERSTWGPGEGYWQKTVKPTEGETVLVMIGRKEAADAAIYVYRVLLRTIEQIADRIACGDRAARNSARLGVVLGLSARVNEMLGECDESSDLDDIEASAAQADVTTTAMVLATAVDESRRHLADAIGFEPYGGQPKFRITDGAAYRAGRDAAKDIEIPDPNGSTSNALRGGAALPPGEDRQLS